MNSIPTHARRRFTDTGLRVWRATSQQWMGRTEIDGPHQWREDAAWAWRIAIWVAVTASVIGLVLLGFGWVNGGV